MEWYEECEHYTKHAEDTGSRGLRVACTREWATCSRNVPEGEKSAFCRVWLCQHRSGISPGITKAPPRSECRDFVEKVEAEPTIAELQAEIERLEDALVSQELHVIDGFLVVTYPADGGYLATCPTLHASVQEATQEEALAAVREAMALASSVATRSAKFRTVCAGGPQVVLIDQEEAGRWRGVLVQYGYDGDTHKVSHEYVGTKREVADWLKMRGVPGADHELYMQRVDAP